MSDPSRREDPLSTRPRRPRDLTAEERHQVTERLRAAREEGDRIAAPLMALQWAEMDAEAAGLINRGKGEGLEEVVEDGLTSYRIVRPSPDILPASGEGDPEPAPTS